MRHLINLIKRIEGLKRIEGENNSKPLQYRQMQTLFRNKFVVLPSPCCIYEPNICSVKQSAAAYFIMHWQWLNDMFLVINHNLPQDWGNTHRWQNWCIDMFLKHSEPLLLNFLYILSLLTLHCYHLFLLDLTLSSYDLQCILICSKIHLLLLHLELFPFCLGFACGASIWRGI